MYRRLSLAGHIHMIPVGVNHDDWLETSWITDEMYQDVSNDILMTGLCSLKLLMKFTNLWLGCQEAHLDMM